MTSVSEILKNGGAVVLPTETVYGLFAKAFDKTAVDKVYQLKQRPLDKALNLNISSYEEMISYSSNQPKYLKKLYDCFLPGPLTIILEANDKVPEWLNSGMKTIGFRVPKHPLTLQFIREHGPLIGPSANISGKKSGVYFDDIMVSFNGRVSGIKDDAFLTGYDSTILDLSGEKAKILRQGTITKTDILSCLPEMTFE
ncbi:L-threonylcarbamoyladenylate synthase [Streptococcus sp. CSL10205-OR2]|uniref:L-threonylcarbamoyladenylate synthase n=1 Tax=Streptococcus sp. CSL10205-OR2 TaxID=2980558 RepID=UPI0021DA86E6|nr:L-threonylcarbamoyladenylate synthase [Streptococcus sp. CSL10205-OR2]MCU9533223.1 L-threonylcarbamoyladenylate synthase [Streptococcus sp. CSL10205-OR2]